MCVFYYYTLISYTQYMIMSINTNKASENYSQKPYIVIFLRQTWNFKVKLQLELSQDSFTLGMVPWNFQYFALQENCMDKWKSIAFYKIPSSLKKTRRQKFHILHFCFVVFLIPLKMYAIQTFTPVFSIRCIQFS